MISEYSSSVKAVAFDLGGVLFLEGKKVAADNLYRDKRYDREIVINALKNPKSLDLRAGIITDDEFWNYLQTGLPAGYDALTIKKYWYDGYVLDKGVLDLVKSLHKNYKIIVFSGNIKSRVEYLDEKYHFRKHFDIEIYSYEYHLNKPDKKFLDVLIDKSDLKAGQLVYIDDDPKMLIKAHGMGILTIEHHSGKTLELIHKLESLGVNTGY